MVISKPLYETCSAGITLQTERLYLRTARNGDLDDFYEMFSNEEVMRYWYRILLSFSFSTCTCFRRSRLMHIIQQVRPTTYTEVQDKRLPKLHDGITRKRRA